MPAIGRGTTSLSTPCTHSSAGSIGGPPQRRLDSTAVLTGQAAFLWAALSLLVYLGLVVAQDPQMSISYFDNLPGRLFFFEDTPGILALPSGEALMVFAHPFDTRYASTTHYRTEDRVPAFTPYPLSFHSDPAKWGYILYQGTECSTYYTTDGFSSDAKELLTDTTRCQFAHSSKDFKHDAHPDLIYCVGFDSSSTGASHSISSSRLYSSTDFFLSKFAVVALKDLSPGADGTMMLYVTVDTKEWAKAQFPHASASTSYAENAYTIVESTVHSLAVDVLSQDQGTGAGYVDYENVYGIEGVGIANTGQPKKLRSMITLNDASWAPLRAPSRDVDGNDVSCNPNDEESCSLHLYSVTNPHNFGRVFSSPAPGFVIGVGSIGRQLAPYEDCDTFMSTDAGLTWHMIQRNAHIYEFGDSGSIILLVDDEGPTDTVLYTLDFGNSWKSYDLGMSIRARGLTSVSDATSQKFMLLVQVARQEQKPGQGRYAIIHLDFAGLRQRKCGDGDFEQWYARAKPETECLLGVKQWYRRRKADADCYVGNKFIDPVVHDEPCPCEDHDYECDYNYVRSGDQCIPSGLEHIPSNMCTSGRPDETYMGSSGYRLIAGDKCDKGRGLRKDEPVSKPCSQAQPAEGEVTSQVHDFPADVAQYEFFKESSTILVRLIDHTIWQSSNEGLTWEQRFPDERFLVFYMNTHTNDRAYLITDTSKYYYTTDGGRFWHEANAPSRPNTFRANVLSFQPRSDYLIWVGDVGCDGTGERCHHGRHWQFIDDYVVNCAWARDEELKIDMTQILCESYPPQGRNNPLQLISGWDYYGKKTKLFDHVVGFTKFSEFLIVAEYVPQRNALDLQVSLDGRTFAEGQFPPGMHPNTHVCFCVRPAVFSIPSLEHPHPYWGNILKSNSNGTYFGLSIENVNRDQYGFVDFEKFSGLDGIALANVVANPAEATLTGLKTLQTRITHNDGGTWKPLTPPPVDSLGQPYSCSTTKCALHIHGYTERTDARATYSSPAVVGVVMAVGNVGETLAPYTESDTFLSRDGGFTWQEVHKDAHLWEFGDSGAPTDHVLFTTDEGLTWREYQFSKDKLRIKAIVTVQEDTSRKFMLIGYRPQSSASSVIVHIDFTSLTHRRCELKVDNPGHDDFELWSPSEERQEVCLFGRQTLYHRRKRDANCVVGKIPKIEEKIVRNCACTEEDFECEFNHVKNDEGKCVLIPGMTPLESDSSCRGNDEYWYERTAYRKVRYSSCEGGYRPDQGTSHRCPGLRGHSTFFWLTILLFPIAVTGVVVWWWYKKSGLARGTIRLPSSTSDHQPFGSLGSGSGNALDTLASVPWFLLGLAGIAYAYVSSSIENVVGGFRSRRGYRDVPVDEDAQILRFEDEEE
ncbi:hypothetical protein EV401DRAFT_2058736 [Pisolithus croceorrhizus]|nr:hypothetical protein EV401DRAFT_2058736 [Pisolithus croceorrhizus]